MEKSSYSTGALVNKVICCSLIRATSGSIKQSTPSGALPVHMVQSIDAVHILDLHLQTQECSKIHNFAREAAMVLRLVGHHKLRSG
jgi:hypothetical protein